MESLNSTAEDEINVSNTSKGSDENVDAIRKYIEEQEKDIEKAKVSEENAEEKAEEKLEIQKETEDETMVVASSVMDMILADSGAKISEKTEEDIPKPLTSTEKGNSTSLSVGSKVEAKDFSEEWYPAEITELDYDEMEVLVHYDINLKKTDEWINVNSPRLRPFTGEDPKPAKVEETVEPPKEIEEKEEVKEIKQEEKVKPVFEIGERCLARWRDNKRFIATILKDLGDGKFEIIFDDGYQWTCSISRLHKWKAPIKTESLSVDTAAQSPYTGPYSPIDGAGPSNVLTPTPIFNTHLFDPTRDYLSSKSERREMKRKLNIKEIFNIGQKKQKIQKVDKPKPPVKRKPIVPKKNLKLKKVAEVKIEKIDKNEIPDAVASIIGTIKEEPQEEVPSEVSKVLEEAETAEEHEPKATEKVFENEAMEIDLVESLEETKSEVSDEPKSEGDPVLEEEVILEQFDKPDSDNQEVIDKMKEVISKLEDGLNEIQKTEPIKIEIKSPVPEPEIKTEIVPEIVPEPEIKPDIVPELPIDVTPTETDTVIVVDPNAEKPKKMKKAKKLRLLQEKRVKKQVEKVKCELEEMKRQFEEMRKQMLMKTQELAQGKDVNEMPESFLLPGEWCCKWVNGQPVGKVSEIEADTKIDANNKPVLPRRSVQVEDKRLPAGWTKHMVRRSVGNSAGKWDVVLVSPENKRFHTKTDMRNYLEANPDPLLKDYEHPLMDFGVHLKLSRRMGWIKNTPDGIAEAPATILPAGTVCSLSPLVKRNKLSLKKKTIRIKKEKRIPIKMKLQRSLHSSSYNSEIMNTELAAAASSMVFDDQPTEQLMPLEDGYVYVGSLKVQVIDNLLRCPAEGCFKNFRNNTLIQMHIKHYHRELRKMLGATPKVLDLAYARAKPTLAEASRPDPKIIKVKIPKPPKREEPKHEPQEIHIDVSPTTPVKDEIPKCQDSPKLRNALANKPIKRPRVLLPVRRMEPEQAVPDSLHNEFENMEPRIEISLPQDALDFETAISTHTVTKPLDKKRKSDKKQKSFAQFSKNASEDEEWFTMNSDVDTRSSFPRSGTPDSKIMDKLAPMSSESNEDQRDPNMYAYTETGERVKIVHMKREEIINCHCGFREEDGLMVQCELCLCWQHALCHNIQRESDVPEKYTCSICLNPRRGRRSRRFLHDQDRMYEGILPGGNACGTLRRSHELSGNLLRLQDALHALRVKYYVATKKDHPKLYLWAKDWEQAEITYTQEKLNSDYSDLSIMINGMDKENMPVKPEDVNMALDIRSSPMDDSDDRFSQRDGQLGSQSLLNGLLSSPGGASIDLPISTSELERLAKSVQEEVCGWRGVCAPQPEAAIEDAACRERLLRHIQRCQALIDTRLDSIEAHVAELESQDPSFGEHYETAEFYPRTKQTIQMLMRDLDTMEELGVMT